MRGDEGIGAIRRSLGLDDRVEAEVHAAGERLVSEIDGWVERFYVRLVADPVAMRILRDEAIIVRLKRSLAAWFAEIFSLPFDEVYQRTREQIGRAHVRIGMPQHLMVTAMHAVRIDVLESVRRIWRDDPATARRVADAVSKALDLELALMLGAYRRRSFELRQHAERSLVVGHLQSRIARERRAAVQAARCYLTLARRAGSEAERATWTERLDAVLAGLGREAAAVSVPESARVRVDIREACQRALAEVSLPPNTGLDLAVEPPGLEAYVRSESLEIALQELVQQAVNRGPGSTVHVRARGEGNEISIEVLDAGASTDGVGLAYSEQVAALHGGALETFPRPGGGRGIRLRLRGAPDARDD